MTSDILVITGLALEMRIGLFDWEKVVRQSLVLDLELVLPFAMVSRVAASDNVEDALDYVTVTKRIRQIASETSCQLIETFAEMLAARLLAEFPLQKLKLSVQKPAALASADGVKLVIERSRNDG